MVRSAATTGIRLSFGPMAPSIARQLHDQEQHPPLSVSRPWQRIADGIMMAALHGVLTESEARRARSRLFMKITAEMD